MAIYIYICVCVANPSPMAQVCENDKRKQKIKGNKGKIKKIDESIVTKLRLNLAHFLEAKM